MYTTTLVECCTDSHWYMHFMNQGYMSDIENCEGWLSPGGHSSGGTALTAKVRGPRFNPGWLPVFLSSLKIFLSLFIMYMSDVLSLVQRLPLLLLYVHVHASGV